MDKPAGDKPKHKLVCPIHGDEALSVYLTLQDVPRGGMVTVYRCTECKRLIWDDNQMATKPDQGREAEDKARTEGARKVVKEHADDQREIADKLRRKMN